MDYSNIVMGGVLPKFSLEEAARVGQRYQANQLSLANQAKKNDLESMQADDAMDEATALRGYRTRMKAGDEEGASEELKGYPELDKKFRDAFDGMTPSQQKIAEKRGRAIGEVARDMLRYPENSLERTAAWNAAADDLYKRGMIDKSHHDQMIKGGYNKDIVQEAVSLGDWIENNTKGSGKTKLETAKIQAEIDKTEAETAKIKKGGGPEDKAVIAEDNRNYRAEVAEYGRNLREAQRNLEKYESGLLETGANTPEEVTALVAKKKKQLWDDLGDPPARGTTVSKSPSKVTGSGTAEDPYTGITSQEDFDRIPPGETFINPKDGKPYRKLTASQDHG